MTARFVGVKARDLVHAVWVPHDLPGVDAWTFESIEREGRTPLVRFPAVWIGKAECGQKMRGVVAGPKHGHDWETFSPQVLCPRCVRKIERQTR